MPARPQRLPSLVVALALLAPTVAAAQDAEFAVLGDMPYGSEQVRSVQYIGRKIRDRGIALVVHVGDAKAGDEPCSDELLTERKDVIYGLQPGRVFYTPGDNDWTDCDRASNGAYDELERLARLREIFFAEGALPAAAGWRIARQSPHHPENARWRLGGVQFLTLHVVGTDNGRSEIERSDRQTALDMVEARDEANIAWLEAAFDAARRADADALVAFMQADPYDFGNRDQRTRPCDRQEPVNCNPYLGLLDRLTVLSDDFDRPVLLVHGSTNRFCLDTGFGGWRATKLWRLNAPGDFVTVDAAVVRVEPGARVPFQVYGLLSGDGVPGCDGR